MKTAKKKASELISKIIPYSHDDGNVEMPLYSLQSVTDAVERAYEEQHESTIKACADNITESFSDSFGVQMMVDSINGVILNTKSV